MLFWHGPLRLLFSVLLTSARSALRGESAPNSEAKTMNQDRSPTGLTTIIVPCWNQIAFTQQCIASLKSHTRPAMGTDRDR